MGLEDSTKVASHQASIWRWREAYQHDFAARMDWNVADEYKKANHNPLITLNSNVGKSIATGSVNSGAKVVLSAKGTQDPDGDEFSYTWFVYKEIGEFAGQIDFNDPHGEELVFSMPELQKGQELHIILEVKDRGEPSLFSYRRIILHNE